MQLHTLTLEDFTQAKAEAVIKWCKAHTVNGYIPLTAGYLHPYELKGHPNFRFMEGICVPMHKDGIAAYRPILFLNNPSRYLLRYETQAKAVPWVRGDLAVLNLDEPHLIDSLEAKKHRKSWQAICYDHEMFKSEQWQPEDVGNYADHVMNQFVEAIIR